MFSQVPPDKSPVKTKQIVLIADVAIAFNWVEYVQYNIVRLFLWFLLLRHMMMCLKCIMEKDGRRVKHKVWSLAVMFSFDPN
jgi:hypothetical protein